jgi:hypothetical protein
LVSPFVAIKASSIDRIIKSNGWDVFVVALAAEVAQEPESYLLFLKLQSRSSVVDLTEPVSVMDLTIPTQLTNQ